MATWRFLHVSSLCGCSGPWIDHFQQVYLDASDFTLDCGLGGSWARSESDVSVEWLRHLLPLYYFLYSKWDQTPISRPLTLHTMAVESACYGLVRIVSVPQARGSKVPRYSEV